MRARGALHFEEVTARSAGAKAIIFPGGFRVGFS